MLNNSTIEAAAQRLAAAASSPSMVILFGSYARGTADEGSDLDLMVIERDLGDRSAEYLRLMLALGRISPGVGCDLLLYPQSEFERRSQVPGAKARCCMTAWLEEARHLLRLSEAVAAGLPDLWHPR